MAAVLALVAFSAASAAVCGATVSAREEMACCKAGHKTCGRMTSASDCCKSRQNASARTAPARLADTPLALPAVVPVMAAFAVRADRFLSASSAISLKRPHDPPHLHTFSLLI